MSIVISSFCKFQDQVQPYPDNYLKKYLRTSPQVWGVNQPLGSAQTISLEEEAKYNYLTKKLTKKIDNKTQRLLRLNVERSTLEQKEEELEEIYRSLKEIHYERPEGAHFKEQLSYKRLKALLNDRWAKLTLEEEKDIEEQIKFFKKIFERNRQIDQKLNQLDKIDQKIQRLIDFIMETETSLILEKTLLFIVQEHRVQFQQYCSIKSTRPNSSLIFDESLKEFYLSSLAKVMIKENIYKKVLVTYDKFYRKFKKVMDTFNNFTPTQRPEFMPKWPPKKFSV